MRVAPCHERRVAGRDVRLIGRRSFGSHVRHRGHDDRGLCVGCQAARIELAAFHQASRVISTMSVAPSASA